MQARLVAPSSYCSIDEHAWAIKALESTGMRSCYDDELLDCHGPASHANTPHKRAAALVEALASARAHDAVWALRGGFGASGVLSHLPKQVAWQGARR